MGKFLKSWAIRVLLVLAGVTVLWLSVAKLEQVRERKLVISASETVGALQLGSTTQAQAQDSLRKYSAFRTTGLDDDAIQLEFENRRWLPFEHSSQWI